MWSVEAWTAQNEPSYVQATYVYMCGILKKKKKDKKTTHVHVRIALVRPTAQMVVHLLLPHEFKLSIACIHSLF